MDMGVERWVVLLLSGVVLNAAAGDIYVCKGANGVNSYQNTPCPTPAAQMGHNTFDPALARPGTRPAQLEAVAQPPEYSDRQQPQQSFTTGSYQPAPEPPTGYQCKAGQKVWLQLTPCPATYMDSQSVDVDGRTVTGEMVRGTGWMRVEKPVVQVALDQGAFCDKIRAGARVPGDSSDSSQSYERTKIKRNQCGG